MKFDYSKLSWLNKPGKFDINEEKISITTEPETDFWQNTYYGFSHDNAPALTQSIEGDFTFQVETSFNSKYLYDHCGLLIRIDNLNWCKVSVEYENDQYSRLGSVVTNKGFSDWATTDISSDIKNVWYRISRRGQDFLIESSLDGKDYKQMRIFHMHESAERLNVGIFASSPLKSSFTAEFTNMKFLPCIWEEHAEE